MTKKTQIVLDSLSAAPGAGKVLGCQAEGSHLNLPWELREVSALIIWSRVKIVYGTFRGVPDVWNEGAS